MQRGKLWYFITVDYGGDPMITTLSLRAMSWDEAVRRLTGGEDPLFGYHRVSERIACEDHHSSRQYAADPSTLLGKAYLDMKAQCHELNERENDEYL